VKRRSPDKPPWRRRYGVIWRTSQFGIPRQPRRGSLLWPTSWVNDGGEDAPLSPRNRWIYHWIIGGIIAIGVALLLILR